VSSPLLLPPPDSLLEADDNETAVLCAPPLSPTCARPLPRLTVGLLPSDCGGFAFPDVPRTSPTSGLLEQGLQAWASETLVASVTAVRSSSACAAATSAAERRWFTAAARIRCAEACCAAACRAAACCRLCALQASSLACALMIRRQGYFQATHRLVQCLACAAIPRAHNQVFCYFTLFLGTPVGLL